MNVESLKRKNQKFSDELYTLLEDQDELRKKQTQQLDISKLHQKVLSNPDMMSILENTIERLAILRPVHDESAKIFNKLNEIEDGQQSMEETLVDQKSELEIMLDTLKDNYIQANIDNLKMRVSKLKQ